MKEYQSLSHTRWVKLFHAAKSLIVRIALPLQNDRFIAQIFQLLEN